MFGNGCCSRASKFVVFLLGLGYYPEFVKMEWVVVVRVLGLMVVVE